MAELDKAIDEKELFASLKSLPNDPGLNGLNKEFMDFFWEDIKEAYLEVFKEILNQKELSETMKIAASKKEITLL